MIRKSLVDRFTEKYIKDDSGCWIWTGALHWEGYGQIFKNGKLELAHRVSYELFNGHIPENDTHHGTVVCHACDVRKCVNPAHLFLGTQRDNVMDAVKKGILQRGERNGRAKLTYQDIQRIRADNRLQRVIADEFGVSQQHISAIKRGVWWRRPDNLT